MFPDHTGLLEEDECFVALGDGQQYDIERSAHIVAMRLPSYFRGDLRKLKLVSKAKLMERCSERGKFFQGIVVGLILSTKGNISQAEQMSGGDFDGDGAWCCWDEEVVPHVTDCPPSNSHLIQSPPDCFRGKEMEWCEPEFSQQIIRFTWRDTVWLSKLWYDMVLPFYFHHVCFHVFIFTARSLAYYLLGMLTSLSHTFFCSYVTCVLHFP